MEKFWPLFLTISITVTILSMAYCITVGYRIDRDIDSVISRATIAASQKDMTEHVETLKENMEQHEMTTGHIALVFKTSLTDLSLHYQTIERILDRLESMKEMGEERVAHQLALEDLRQVLRELPRFEIRWVWTHCAWWMLIINLILWIITFISLPGEW